MRYTPEQRERVAAEAAGKTVESLEWEEGEPGEDGYWVMTFEDRTEISFRFMAEMN